MFFLIVFLILLSSPAKAIDIPIDNAAPKETRYVSGNMERIFGEWKYGKYIIDKNSGSVKITGTAPYIFVGDKNIGLINVYVYGNKINGKRIAKTLGINIKRCEGRNYENEEYMPLECVLWYLSANVNGLVITPKTVTDTNDHTIETEIRKFYAFVGDTLPEIRIRWKIDLYDSSRGQLVGFVSREDPYTIYLNDLINETYIPELVKHEIVHSYTLQKTEDDFLGEAVAVAYQYWDSNISCYLICTTESQSYASNFDDVPKLAQYIKQKPVDKFVLLLREMHKRKVTQEEVVKYLTAKDGDLKK